MTTDSNGENIATTAPTRAKLRAATAVPSTATTTVEASLPSRPKAAPPAADNVASPPPPLSKLDRLAALLADPAGATIAVMSAATGWQAHSVRGAMAGALRKRGLTMTSSKTDGVRTYRAGPAV